MKKNFLLLGACAGLLASYVAFGEEYKPSLIGGVAIDKAAYPETIYIKQGNSRCTASVIGPYVIMTAGHCVPDGGEIQPASWTPEPEVTFDYEEVAATAKCKQHPLYRDNKEDLDFALCHTSVRLDVKYGIISKKGPALGDVVSLAGYGCIQAGGGGGNDGVLRVGQAKVTQLPSGASDWYFAQGGSALCFGDSGGPSFLKIGDPKSEDHFIIGVNSRGNIKDLSLLTALYLDKSIKFFEDFAKAEGVEICGINKECGKPGPKPEEPKPEEPKKCKKLREKSEEYKKKYDACMLERAYTVFDEELEDAVDTE